MHIECYKKLGRYRYIARLGKGSYGRVDLYYDKETHMKVAIKCIPRKKHDARLDREILFLLELRGQENIIKILDVMESRDYVWIVMEYAECGELFEYIIQRGHLSLEESFLIFKQLVNGLYACHHGRGIVHRDLKPENILLTKKKDGQLKVILGDFGFSNRLEVPGSNKKLQSSQFALMETYCGSPYYASPEMVQGKPYIGTGADIWSLGVILYAMVFGRLPFDDLSTSKLFEKIVNATFKCPIDELLMPCYSKHSSKNHPTSKDNICCSESERSYKIQEFVLLEDLLSRMMEKNAEIRIPLKDILRHPWYLYMDQKSLLPPLKSKSFLRSDSPSTSTSGGGSLSSTKKFNWSCLLRKCSNFLKRGNKKQE